MAKHRDQKHKGGRHDDLKVEARGGLDIRIGGGSDDHRIEPAAAVLMRRGDTVKPLLLAGTLISTDYSIVAVSDGDVVYHAVMNALLLAAGRRDIGYYFSPADPGNAGRSSRSMMKIVMQMIGDEDDFRVNNATVMITTKAPRISPHIDKMVENLARALRVDESRVGIGATSGEELWQTGRYQGIHAEATVLLSRGAANEEAAE